jgi:hypothetical protein
MSMENWWNDTDRRKLMEVMKTCPIATFSTTYANTIEENRIYSIVSNN